MGVNAPTIIRNAPTHEIHSALEPVKTKSNSSGVTIPKEVLHINVKESKSSTHSSPAEISKHLGDAKESMSLRPYDNKTEKGNHVRSITTQPPSKVQEEMATPKLKPPPAKLTELEDINKPKSWWSSTMDWLSDMTIDKAVDHGASGLKTVVEGFADASKGFLFGETVGTAVVQPETAPADVVEYEVGKSFIDSGADTVNKFIDSKTTSLKEWLQERQKEGQQKAQEHAVQKLKDTGVAIKTKVHKVKNKWITKKEPVDADADSRGEAQIDMAEQRYNQRLRQQVEEDFRQRKISQNKKENKKRDREYDPDDPRKEREREPDQRIVRRQPRGYTYHYHLGYGDRSNQQDFAADADDDQWLTIG